MKNLKPRPLLRWPHPFSLKDRISFALTLVDQKSLKNTRRGHMETKEMEMETGNGRSLTEEWDCTRWPLFALTTQYSTWTANMMFDAHIDKWIVSRVRNSFCLQDLQWAWPSSGSVPSYRVRGLSIDIDYVVCIIYELEYMTGLMLRLQVRSASLVMTRLFLRSPAIVAVRHIFRISKNANPIEPG